ncbi:hypothetical protein [Nodosilinea nodulosa]|uniref:hypothetical protein n=1 Tax=Nodosilinea nodulosa TaxID=416001 RepID=UPI0002FE4650|nr:hypothetical protein [Nodosilinea nodulosa]
MSTQNSEQRQPISQPLTPEEVSPEQKAAHKKAMEEGSPALNPGDRVEEEKSLEEKSKQVAVDTGDITGDRIVVPTYFVVDDPEEGQKALHHVKDAEEISDVIRQARVDESGERTWN